MRPGTTAVVEVDAIAGGTDGLERPVGPSAWQVQVEDGRIAAVTPVDPVPDRLRILAPTLLDAHDHGRGHGTLQLGVRDAPLDEWIQAFLEATPRDVQYQQCLVAMERLRDGGVGGTSVCINPTTADLEQEVRHVVAAARAAGIRCAVAVPVNTRRGPPRADRDRDAGRRQTALDTLDRIDRLAAELEGPDVSLAYHPVAPQWVDEDVLVACAERSAVTGRVVHTHFFETAGQREWADRTYETGLLDELDAMGLLTPRLVLAHGVHLRPDELALLAERGCTVAVNVSSNFRLASGVVGLQEIADAGTRLAIGLDGMALDDDSDMWRELRLVRGLWQGQRRATVDAGAVLDAATAGGTAGFGPAAPEPVRLGSLADFVVHDLPVWSAVARRTGWSAAELLLAGASRSSVTDVWCAGSRVGRRRPAPAPSSAEVFSPT